MSKILDFIKSIRNIPIRAPEPKYSVGDILFNSKFKVFCKVIKIDGIFENEDGTINYDQATYILEDVKNTAHENYLKEQGMDQGQQQQFLYREKNGVKYRRKRYKPVQLIDTFYDKVESEAALILYGIKLRD